MTGWKCPKCGPVSGYLPGKKGEPHCINDDCDLELTYERMSPEPIKAPEPMPAIRKKSSFFEDEKKRAAGIREAKAILAGLEARQKKTEPRKEKPVTEAVKTEKPPEETKTQEPKRSHKKKPEVGAAKAVAHEVAVLAGLAKPETQDLPPGQYHTVHAIERKPADETESAVELPEGRSTDDYGKNMSSLREQLAVMANRKKDPPRPKPQHPAPHDGLTRELKAVEAIVLELSGLQPQAARRILRFARDRVTNA